MTLTKKGMQDLCFNACLAVLIIILMVACTTIDYQRNQCREIIKIQNQIINGFTDDEALKINNRIQRGRLEKEWYCPDMPEWWDVETVKIIHLRYPGRITDKAKPDLSGIDLSGLPSRQRAAN